MSAKILVVDDEPQIRRVLKTVLVAEDYEVEGVKSAMEAFHAIRDARFDLILLDFNMPEINGLEACESIRRTSEVPIVMLTVRDSESDVIAALDAGADDYVRKPFSMPELLARIRANLRRAPFANSNHTEALTFGPVRMDLKSRHVFADNRDVHVTPKEFDLLYYLASHPNTTLTHGKLLQAVWGPDYGHELAYLHVFMNQIRKKIEPDPTHPRYILTEPRIGYRFVPAGSDQ